MSQLATAAGDDDPERWWEDVVEHVPGTAVFAALAEAIAILRAEDGERPENEVREAYMRKVLRKTVKDGYQQVAVVCGAWHVPAVTELPSAAADDRLLRGLPRVKPAFTWVPWTYGRLAYASGYGAGIRSPGWYDHLFSAPGQPVERWLAKAAAVLREQGIPASSAHVIESVRLAEALAALRGRPLAGLEEVTEAARAVLCEGSDLLTGLIERRLVVGERLGAVPAADTHGAAAAGPAGPAASPAAAAGRGAPGLRPGPAQAHRPGPQSPAAHRLALVEVRWGTRQEGQRRNIGTFRESWQLTWRPELDLALIEASMWGSTVAAAAEQRARAPRRRVRRPGRAGRADRAVPAGRPGPRPARRCWPRSGTAPRWTPT